MTTLPELSRRVSEAEGPSRELDAEVYIALEIPAPRVGRIDRMGGVVGWHPIDAPYQSSIEVPRYTASLDAVAALIADNLPGCGWQVGQTEEDMGFRCWARVLKRSALFAPPNGVAATPALALLAAALLAIHKRNKRCENV